MSFVQNIPSFSIMAAMFAAIITSAVGGKAARKISLILIGAIGIATIPVLAFTLQNGSFVYVMGHFPAPWGNEIRAGILEAVLAILFCVIMFMGLLGGRYELYRDLEDDKVKFYYIMTDLLMASLLALVYTNDLFTAYVFVEINTIAACGLIIMKYNGRTIHAGARYMIMSLMGSGLLLLGICYLYNITGNLLMSSIKDSVAQLLATGAYRTPLLMSFALMGTGLAIKSALWPFHTWLPNAYGYSTTSSSVMLSSLVSKGYIFLLIKIMFRVMGLEMVAGSKMLNIFLVFGLIAMIKGSIDAIKEDDIRRMIAYSSVAQIGYIYTGLGLGTDASMNAAFYHICAHAAAKSLVFIAASGLILASGGKWKRKQMYGAGFRNKFAGFGFAIGAMSMIGIPGLAGFASKYALARASLECGWLSILVLLALALSTILNAVYFMRVMIVLFTPAEHRPNEQRYDIPMKNDKVFVIAVIALVAVNLFLGICYGPLTQVFQNGFAMFG